MAVPGAYLHKDLFQSQHVEQPFYKHVVQLPEIKNGPGPGIFLGKKEVGPEEREHHCSVAKFE